MADGVVVPRTDDSVLEIDVAAAQKIQNYQVETLERLPGRATKWIGGLTALTGVLTTAVVIKGPDTFTKLVDDREILWFTINPQDLIIGLMLVGGLLLAMGVWFGYTAANGDPFSNSELDGLAMSDNPTIDGAASTWREAMKSTTRNTRKHLQRAALCSILGTILLAIAVLVTWTTPTASTTAAFCTPDADGTVTILEGSVPDVTEGRLVLVPCPDS